jgi:hypothetical protein
MTTTANEGYVGAGDDLGRSRTEVGVSLLSPRCPVPPREQAWIEKMLAWCFDQLGDLPLRNRVVEPTAEFFPDPYLGAGPDVLRVVDRVRVLLGIDADRVEVELAVNEASGDLNAMVLQPGRRTVVAGHYQQRGERGYIRIDPLEAGDQSRLIAVAAHEFCHELLLGRGGVPGADGKDHEPLTDLLTVFTGFGVFTANAAFSFESSTSGWRTRRLGYMTVPMFGYALACCSWLRGEAESRDQPPWARFLDANPRGYMKQGTRYLEALGPSPALAGLK